MKNTAYQETDSTTAERNSKAHLERVIGEVDGGKMKFEVLRRSRKEKSRE